MSFHRDRETRLWKAEPASPRGTPTPSEDDDWFFIDHKSEDIVGNDVECAIYDEHPTRAQVASKLLEELDEWIKEEPLDWLEEKIEDLPIFDEIPAPECGQNKPIVYSALAKPQHQQQETTQTLLQEFENVLGDVEACHQFSPTMSTALTPPQSPPPNKALPTGAQLLVTLQPVQSIGLSPSQHSLYQTITIPVEKSPSSFPRQVTVAQAKPALPVQYEDISLDPLGDVARELAAVDEFVRSCAEDISPSSPCTSSGGGSYASSEDSVDDPDWTPSPGVAVSPPSKPSTSSRNRRKPYSRPNVEDKKVRKKEQNKNAATRYRQKKKQEVEEIQGEERELTEYNEKLQGQLQDLQREIGYLKGLMRDLFRAKGLMK